MALLGRITDDRLDRLADRLAQGDAWPEEIRCAHCRDYLPPEACRLRPGKTMKQKERGCAFFVLSLHL